MVGNFIMNAKPKLVVIVGPTASGKTEFAVSLAKTFDGEIVSADSRQIYKGMDIGTAKPKGELIGGQFIYKGIVHHCINIITPDKPFTVAQYKQKALQSIHNIVRRHKLPILIGGTGLYIKSIIDNLDIPQVPPQPKLREQLEKELQAKGVNYLFNKLVALDPEAAYIVDPHNPRRIIRALEITLVNKKPFSSQRKLKKSLFNSLQIGIIIPKTELFSRIDARINTMIRNGLLKEVKNLAHRFEKNTQAFDAIGYRELLPYLHDQTGIEQGIALMKQNTKNYAKRQLTWFKKDKRIQWVSSPAKAKTLVRAFLKK